MSQCVLYKIKVKVNKLEEHSVTFVVWEAAPYLQLYLPGEQTM